MSDKDRCQNHPDQPVTARCLRFDRRFCELDFEEGGEAECLSKGTYCEYRSQCMIWEKLRKKKRRERMAARG